MQSAKRTAFESDLSKLRSFELEYTEFERRHRGILHSTARRWHRFSRGLVDEKDLYQDILETTWRALDEFKPEKNVPLVRWVHKCVTNQLHKKTSRALKRPQVERTHVERYGRRDEYAPDTFLANVDDAVHFRRRLDGLLGIVDARTGEFALGVVSGRGFETVRQEVFADYSIAGAIKQSRIALGKVLKAVEGLDD